jgi:hypothetical protein
MGYELNLHIGKKVTWEKGEKGIVETAKFDLSKPGGGHLMNLLTEERNKIKNKTPNIFETPADLAYIFASDGDTKIKKDSYDEFLFHVDPKKVLKAMVADNKERPYRVYRLVASYLRGAIVAYKNQELTCIFYGH